MMVMVMDMDMDMDMEPYGDGYGYGGDDGDDGDGDDDDDDLKKGHAVRKQFGCNSDRMRGWYANIYRRGQHHAVPLSLFPMYPQQQGPSDLADPPRPDPPGQAAVGAAGAVSVAPATQPPSQSTRHPGKAKASRSRLQKKLEATFKGAKADSLDSPSERTTQRDVKTLMDVVKKFPNPKRLARSLEVALDKPEVRGALEMHGSAASRGLSRKEQEAMLMVSENSKENHGLISRKRSRDTNAARHGFASIATGVKTKAQRLISATYKLFGVSRDAIQNAVKRKVEFLVDGALPDNMTWAILERARRCDRHPDAWVVEATLFWKNNTRVSAEKGDLLVPPAHVQREQGITRHDKQPRQYLEMSQTELYREFEKHCLKVGCDEEKFPELVGIKMGQRAFERCKPWYVRAMRRSDKQTCACKYHVNVRSQLLGLHKTRVAMQRLGADMGECPAPLLSINDNVAAMLCPPQDGDDFYALPCLKGQCDKCGPDKLFRPTPWEASGAQYVEMTTTDAEGKEVTRSIKVPTCTFEFVEKVPVPIEKLLPDHEQQYRMKLSLVDRKEHPSVTFAALMERSPDEGVDSDDEDIMPLSVLLQQQQNAGATSDVPQAPVSKTQPFGWRQFVLHQHTMRWQAQLYKDDVESFPKGTVILAMDFAENHSFDYKVQAQSLYYSPHQSTVFVMVAYRHGDPKIDGVPDDGGRHIIKDHLFFCSDCGIHDQCFVDKCVVLYLRSTFKWPADVDAVLEAVYGKLCEGGDGCPPLLLPPPDLLDDWTDGCGCQFKSKEGFNLFAQMSANFGIPIVHNFFCSNHGKGEHDGAGANVKHEASLYNLKSEVESQLKNAANLVEWGNSKFTNIKGSTYQKRRESITLNKRVFHLIEKDAVDRSRKPTLKPIAGGIRNQHQFIYHPEDGGEYLRIREFGCLCEFCRVYEFAKCLNLKFAPEPRVVKMELLGQTAAVTRQGAARIREIRADSLSLDSETGRHCTFTTDEPGWDYFMMRVTELPHILDKDVTDDLGMVFAKGSAVVAGNYYERYPPDVSDSRWRSKEKRLYFLDTRLAYQYTHLVCATHFELPVFAKPGAKVNFPISSKSKRKSHVAERRVDHVPQDLHERLVWT